MDLQLKDKVAIVTGGAKGIGAGVTEALAEEGARGAVIFRSDPEGSAAACAAIAERTGAEVVPFQYDVAIPENVDKIFDEVREKMGPVDILVNNAAGGTKKPIPFDEMTYEQWEDGINGCLNHVFTMCKRFVCDCKADGRPGHIVNFSAKAAFFQNGRDKAHYVAAKGAIASLTRAIAKEATEFGIIANSVVPGYVIADNHYHPGDADYNSKLALLPTGKFATPIEIGHIVAFLCSPMSGQIIGAQVDVSGGTMI